MAIDSWISFSLLSAFLMAVVNIIDKFILTKWIRNPMLLVVFFGIIGLVPSLMIFGVRGLPLLSGFNILLAFLAGGAYLLMSFFYFRAAQLEEISRVVPLFYLAPFFVSIFAFLFLGEFFSPRHYAGIAFLIAGAMLILNSIFSSSIFFAFHKQNTGGPFAFEQVSPLCDQFLAVGIFHFYAKTCFFCACAHFVENLCIGAYFRLIAFAAVGLSVNDTLSPNPDSSETVNTD